MTLFAGRTVGILGGGQLARMLALAGLPLGVHAVVLEPDGEAPARFCAEHLRAPYTDAAGLERLAACDAVTLEFENVPVEALAALDGRVPVRPGGQVLHLSKHRAREKTALREAGAGTAPFAVIEAANDLSGALAQVGGAGILKTSELGYDGKGQARVNSDAELRDAWAGLGEVPCVLEGLVPFARELSLGVARNPSSEVAFGPLVENVHRGGVLRTSTFVPGRATNEAAARDIARRVAEAWRLEGLLTLEFFELPDGTLLVNEVAPRVHNSGHLTQDGASISQFEAQLRAVLDLPLLDFAPSVPCGMVNVLGWPQGQEPDWSAVLRTPGARLHLYDKAHREGRKVGHVNVTAPDALTLAARMDALSRLIP